MTATGVTTGLYDRLAAVVAETLRVPVACVGPSDSFASLGTDSLAAVELTVAIQDELGIDLPLSAVHEYPNLDSLCGFIEGDPSHRHDRLLADAVLPADITPARHRIGAVHTRDAAHVLLTGATGFVGAYLLRALLDETPATVHCLVRPGPVDALTRVRRNLAKYGLWDSEVAHRLRIVTGDVAGSMLGLSRRDFQKLAAEVDVIYHAAADVNWVHGYDALRDTNVLGTREILRLACEGVPKPLHFLSSISVCHSTTGPRVADETSDTFAAIEGLRLGYAQSKCVAEELVRQAGARGLPVTIIRPSLVSGDAESGRSNVDDLTSRFIAGCIRMHAAPDLDWRMDCVPVDHVAKSIVGLSREHGDGVAVLHITADQPRHWRECVLWMRLCGYDVELLPYREWTDVLRTTDDVAHPLNGLRTFFLHPIAAENDLTLPELLEESRRAHVCGARTRRMLERVGYRGHRLDSRLLNRYFGDFILKGAVPDVPGRRPAEGNDAPTMRGCEERLATTLGQLLNEQALDIHHVELTSLASDDSIVAELTAWRAGTRSGLYHADVAFGDSTGAERSVRMFIKAKAADSSVIEVAEALAALASPALGETVARFRDHLGFTRCHIRELALYAHADERLRAYAPRPLLIDRDDDQRRWLLALESIDDALLFDATETTKWNNAAIDAAIVGLTQIQSVYYRRESELSAEPWLAPIRDERRRVEMTPLWAALAEHARERSEAWGDHRLRRAHERLVGSVASWSSVLDRVPRTLIHNDFNPRNVGVRRTPEGLRLCAFDWELATLGAPQRDLAEFLCFVLPPDASRSAIARWVERHCSLLAVAAGTSVDRAEWETGFSAALCDLLVDRLASYAMVDRIRPQRFLPRVVQSWLNIFRHFPWVGDG